MDEEAEIDLGLQREIQSLKEFLISIDIPTRHLNAIATNLAERTKVLGHTTS